MNALAKRINALHEQSDKVFKREEVEVRMDRLANLYHYGYGDPSMGAGAAGYVSEGADQRDRVVHVNKVYPRVRTAMSSLFAKRPEIIARGRRSQDSKSAETAEVLLNYLTRHMHYAAELREWLFWSRLCMYGVLKLGMEKDAAGRSLPMIRAVNPRSVRVDVSSTDRFRPQEGTWQGFKFKRTLTGLRQGGLYKDSELNKLSDEIARQKGTGYDPDVTEVWIWEHYIREGKDTMLVVSANGWDDRTFDAENRVWLREEPFTDVIGLPGRFLFFVPSPKTFFPVSPVELWLDQQKEINAFRTQKLIHAERSNRRRFYDPNAFGEEAASMLEGNEPRQYLPVPNAERGLDKAVFEEPLGPVSEDVYKGEFEADETITEIDGIGSVQLGRTGQESGSTSATRDSLVENSLRLRMSDNQEVWEDALEDVYQSVFNLAQTGMTGELRLKITNVMEMTLSRQEIQGDVDIILSFGSTQPRDREVEFEKAEKLYAMFNGNPLVNQERLVRYVLQKQGDIKDLDLWMAPPMEPPAGANGLPPLPGGGLPGAPPMARPEDLNSLALQGTQGGMSPLSFAARLRGLT